MAQEPTLLAHLVPRLTSQVEDAATDALAFILNKSEACRVALDRFIWDGDRGPEPITRVETQVTYEDGSRPDMVGYDQSGSKRLLVESKFWATLPRPVSSTSSVRTYPTVINSRLSFTSDRSLAPRAVTSTMSLIWSPKPWPVS